MNLIVRNEDLTPGQSKFIRSRAPQVLLSGGYGSGKTLGLGLKLLQLKSENPEAPGMLVAATWRQMWSVTLRRLLGFLRFTLKSWKLLPKVIDRQGECFLDFGDGVPIFLRSANNPESLEGIDVGYLLGDELRLWSRRSYETAIGRRRVKCNFPQSAFSSTPDFNWMAGEFGQGTEGRELIVSPTYENERNLVPGYIDNLKLSYSKRLQRAVLQGQFTVLEGAVFEDFDPSPNGPWVIDYDARANPDLKTYLWVDPGYRRSSWAWVQQVGKREWVMIDQMSPEESSDVTNAQKANGRGWPIDEIWCDPAADSTQELTAASTLQALDLIKTRQREPIRIISGPWRSIPFGVDKVRVILGNNEDLPIRLRFSKECAKKELNQPRGIMKDLAAYRYPEIKDGHPVTDMPLKDGISDHSCLAGHEEVFVKDNGWCSLKSLDGDRWLEILCADGYRKAPIVTKTSEAKKLYEISLESGETVVATGDHRFLVCQTCGCGRSMPGVSWLTVLQMRALFLALVGKEIPEIASESMDAFQRDGHPHWISCSSCRRKYTQQSTREFGSRGVRKTPEPSSEKAPVGNKNGGAKESTRSSRGVAQVRGWPPLPQMAIEKIVGDAGVPGIYLPSVRQEIQESAPGKNNDKILSPQLQNGRFKVASWYTPEPRKISSISEAGVTSTYCTYIPKTHSFLLRQGMLSGNCDAIRYGVVGLWLTTSLRELDPALQQSGKPGYRVGR